MQDKLAEHDSYDPSYFSHLFEVEDRHFWFRARNRVITAAVARVTARLAPGYRFLEVGCGTGNVLRALEQTCKGGLVVGMDLFGEGLSYARRRVSCPLVQGDIHANPFGTRFEAIGLFDVLEHLPNDVEVLSELRSMLTPGGALILTVPAHMSLWSYFDEASHHCRRYEQAELARKLKAAGYRVEFMSQYMATIFPLVWVGRRWAAFTRRKAGNAEESARRTHELTIKELRITPIVNGALAWILEQEARLIARRHKLPLGTSLLAVARTPVPNSGV
jgi:SAM-dependent methyltransferase